VIITATPGLFSGLVSIFVSLTMFFDSGFLFVTGAFNCALTNFAAALDKGFAVDVASALALAFGPDLAGFFARALFGDLSAAAREAATFGLPDVLAATGFAASLVLDLDDVDLALAGFAFLAESVRGFAGLFIAFAMESTAN
jgi:hypothetical protein